MEIRFSHFLRVCWDSFCFCLLIVASCFSAKVSLIANFTVFPEFYGANVEYQDYFQFFNVTIGKKKISMYTYFCILIPQFLLDKILRSEFVDQRLCTYTTIWKNVSKKSCSNLQYNQECTRVCNFLSLLTVQISNLSKFSQLYKK